MLGARFMTPERKSSRSTTLRSLLLACGLLLLWTAPAFAKSALIFPYPREFGVIPASTYNDAGKRIGDASINVEKTEDGKVVLTATSGQEGGAGNTLSATLEVIDVAGKPALRVLYERSQSFDPKGKPLVVLEVDHEKREASCTPPGKNREHAKIVTLEDQDRVANVPLHLLFRPLVEGEIDEIDVNVFFCLGGPRILNFRATARDIGPAPGSNGNEIREVSYAAAGGSLISWVAKKLGPTIYFWFEGKRPSKYMAHYLPLYSGGPEVYVVREGVDPTLVIRERE
jgi:hypothetical protein